MFRYLKGDRIIKINKNNFDNSLYQLSKLNYPYLLYKLSNEDGFMICGDKSCFSNTKDINELNELISNSF